LIGEEKHESSRKEFLGEKKAGEPTLYPILGRGVGGNFSRSNARGEK